MKNQNTISNFILEITKDISIEELVEGFPGAVSYMMRKGIKCIACGDPIWGTLEEAAKEKGFSDEEIEGFVKELKENQKNNE